MISCHPLQMISYYQIGRSDIIQVIKHRALDVFNKKRSQHLIACRQLHKNLKVGCFQSWTMWRYGTDSMSPRSLGLRWCWGQRRSVFSLVSAILSWSLARWTPQPQRSQYIPLRLPSMCEHVFANNPVNRTGALTCKRHLFQFLCWVLESYLPPKCDVNICVCYCDS